MTYPKKLSITAQLTIAPFEKKILALKPGESLGIHGTVEDLDKIRQHLYAWRYINRLHEIIIRRDDPEQLRITRRSIPKATIVGHETETTGQCFMRDKLLELESEDDCLNILREACDTNELSTEDAQEALEEWRRIQG